MICIPGNECPTVVLADSIGWWKACATSDVSVTEDQLIIAKHTSHISGTSWGLTEKQLHRTVSTLTCSHWKALSECKSTQQQKEEDLLFHVRDRYCEAFLGCLHFLL